MGITKTKEARLNETEEELIRLYRSMEEREKPMMIASAKAIADVSRAYANVIDFPKQG